MSLSRAIEKQIAVLDSLLGRIAFTGPLLARIVVGYVFIESGWGKVHNLDKVTEFFTDLGIPAPGLNAVFVSWVELVCGTLVLLGLGARSAAVPLMGTMGVALITAKAEEISSLSDVFGLSEFNYLVLLFWLLIAGPGGLSLDGLRMTSLKRRSPAAVMPASS